MGPQSEQIVKPEIKVRLAAVIQYLYAVAGPDDPMLQALVRRYEQMEAQATQGTLPSPAGNLLAGMPPVWNLHASQESCKR
jgi:hypothetical protein